MYYVAQWSLLTHLILKLTAESNADSDRGMKRLIVQVSGAASIDRPPHLAEAFFNRQRYGGDWLLKA
jgi:hypothetical protein